MNTLTKTIVAILLVGAAFAGDENTKLPANAQAALDKVEAAVAANRATYDKANQKPLADAEKALKAEIEKQTKAGNLNGALAIQKALDGLRERVVAKVDEQAKDKADLLGDSNKKLVIVSAKWGTPEKSIDITKMVVKEVKNNSLSFVGTFQTLGDPLPGAAKSLVIVYTLGGGEPQTSTFYEGKGCVVAEINLRK